MKLNNTSYEIIKWVVQVVLPAFILMIGTIGTAIEWPHTELTMTVLSAITTFLGASLGLSSANYYKDKEEEK